MFSPQELLASSTISQDGFEDHQSLLTRLNLVFPAPDNKHIAFRFLLDVALRIYLSPPTDGVFLGMLVKGNVTPLRTAKLSLLKLLNPAWHPILDECEQQLEPYLNGPANTPFPAFSASTPSNEPDHSTSLPQATPLSHIQQSPQSADSDFNADNDLLFWSGYDYSTDDLGSLPMHMNNYAAWLESGVPCRNAMPSAPLVDGAACSTGAELGRSFPTSSTEECKIPPLSGMHEYMAIPNTSSHACPMLPGEPSHPTSTYSSLLPESHCPPFANLNQSSVGSRLPSPDAISLPYEPSVALTSHDFLKNSMTDTVWLMNHAVPTPFERQDYPSSLGTLNPYHSAAPSAGFTERTVVREVEGVGRNGWIDLPDQPSTTPPSYVPTGRDNSGPPSGNDASSRQHGEYIPAASRAPSKKKRPKRIFERPPGLPFGPWTPGDKGPSPATAPIKKPRKVKRAPANESRSTLHQGLSDKVSCPKCSTVVLAKSLNRHLERHYNWEKGGYCAHLYCRYCFAPYSRMDLLVRHQKTDAQCVMLQYDIYWNERQSYLEKQLQIWSNNAGRAQ